MIAGFTLQHGDNLVESGLYPQGGSGLTYAHVPNQPNAVNIPIGAPMSDGNTGILVATDTTIFQGITNVTHELEPGDLLALAGLAKDAATGNWYVNMDAAAAAQCVQITDLIGDIGHVAQRVGFRVLRNRQQLFP